MNERRICGERKNTSEKKTLINMPECGRVRRNTRITEIALLVTTLIWGNSFVAIKLLLNEMDPFSIAAVRFMVSAPFFLIFLWTKRGEWRIEKRDRWTFLLLGLMSVPMYHLPLNYGAQFIPAGTVSILIALNPVFTALFAGIFLKEDIRGWKALGILMGFSGAVLIAVSGGKVEFYHILGVLIVIIAPLSWAFYTIISKPLLRRYNPIQLTSYITLIGGAMLFPFWPQAFSESIKLSLNGWLAMIYIGFICVSLGYTVWYWALSRKEAYRTAIFVYFIPVSGLIGAYFILGEVPHIIALVGGALILLGIWVVNRHDTQ